MEKIKVLNEQLTIDKLSTGKYSLVRHGDGEWELIFNTGLSFFKNALLFRKIKTFGNGGLFLNHRMRKVVKSNLNNLLIGVPNVFEADSKQKWKTKYYYNNLERMASFLNHDVEYCSTFFVRYNKFYPVTKEEHWESIQNIWADKKICIVNFNSDVCNHDVFSIAKEIQFIKCGQRNAYGFLGFRYRKVLKKCMEVDADMILTSAGPMSKVLAYDLSLKGKICIDIGQLARMYNVSFGVDAEDLY